MKKLLPVYVKELEKKNYLISNRLSKFLIINNMEYQELKEQKKRQDLDINYEPMFQSDILANKLEKNMFLIDVENLKKYSEIYQTQNIGLFHSAGLHIFVLTLECNLKCLYCQAEYEGNEYNMMNKTIAKKAVDVALSSPENVLTFEFQGGEPLLNFETLQYIIEYSEQVKGNKLINYALVNNGQAMTEWKLDYLVEKNVSICFSIDGPAHVHDRNRPSKDGTSNHAKVVYWYNRAKEEFIKKGKKPRVTALPTTTRFSLDYANEIVEFYHDVLKEKSISIRPLSPFGRARKNWKDIQYSAEEFIRFYEEGMKCIRKYDDDFTEAFSRIIMDKLMGKIVNYPDLRSPCGGGTGQLAYNWNGNIYTCDEGRMLANQGDEIFKVGTVDDDYSILINSKATLNVCAASCLENHQTCCKCVFHPICGICPVYNYVQQNDLQGKPLEMDRCKIMMGQMNYLIEWMNCNEEKEQEVFRKWTKM